MLSDLTTCLDGRGHAWEVFLINPKDGKVEECTRQRGNQGSLTRQTFVSKVMSLLFNMLSRLVIAFLLLISWLQSPSAVILEPKKRKAVTVSIVSPSVCHEVMGLDAMIFIF